jgi:hypothetical protein
MTMGQEIAFILAQSELLLIFIELMNYKRKRTMNSFKVPKGDRVLEWLRALGLKFCLF